MTRVVILAAGKGTRMKSENLPKVLHPLNGRPMLDYVLDAIKESKVDARPIVVIGHLAEKIKEVCGTDCAYALQTSLRGTGDAVRSARAKVGDADTIIVLNGDMPFVKASSIRNVIETHRKNNAVMTMGTVVVEDFNEWRHPFESFGRIIRDGEGRVLRITESRDATKNELQLKEVNPSVFCFNAPWLWAALETLTTENAQEEYYITDLLEKAVNGERGVVTIPIEPMEAIGINTPQQLAFAETIKVT